MPNLRSSKVQSKVRGKRPPSQAQERVECPAAISPKSRERESSSKGSKQVSSMSLPGLTLTSMGDALSEPPEKVRWVWDGFLPTGGSSLLSAKPKVGKSTLARCLALSVARGSPFLGVPVHQGAVIYLSLEDKRAETILHFRDLGSVGSEPLLLSTETRVNDPKETLESLGVAVQASGAILVVIDTLIRFAPFTDINDYVQAKQMCEPFWVLCREYNCHVMLVHHCRKKSGGSPSDNQMGSQGIGGGVDTLIEIRKSKRSRTLWSEQRYGDDIRAMVLSMDLETRWVGCPEERYRSYVLQVLTDSLKPLTQGDLKVLIKGDNRRVAEALESLVDARLVERTGSGKSGHPYLYDRRSFTPPPLGGSKQDITDLPETPKALLEAQNAWSLVRNEVKPSSSM